MRTRTVGCTPQEPESIAAEELLGSDWLLALTRRPEGSTATCHRLTAIADARDGVMLADETPENVIDSVKLLVHRPDMSAVE